MNRFEQLIEYVINDEEQKARELFHDIVVEKSRAIYENLMAEEAEEELDEAAEEELDEAEEEEDLDEGMMGGDASDDLIDNVETEEEMSMESEDDADAEFDDEAEEADDEAEVDFQALAEMMYEEEDQDEMVEVDEAVLAEEILRIRKMVREGKVDHQFGGKGEGRAGVDGSFGGKGNGKAGVKKSFGGGAEGQDAFTNPPTLNKLAEAFRTERRKNRVLDEKLKKYRSAVDTLREQLEDLNLFNAKLLYVNKLLQNKNLNESEKKSVIKALDEANSLREAKSLYKSLTETFTHGGKKTLSESRSRGSSSRPTTSSAPKGGAPELDRWQKLAGLK